MPKTIIELVQEYQSHVESIVPDLAGDMGDNDEMSTDLQDNIYDYACDHIGYAERNSGVTQDDVRSAASQIAKAIA